MEAIECYFRIQIYSQWQCADMCKRIVDFLLCHILWCVCGIGLFSSLASWQVGVQLNDNGWKYEPSRHCLGIDIHIQSINKQFSLWMILWMCAMQMPINRIECAIQKGTQKFFAFKIKLHSLYCRLVFFFVFKFRYLHIVESPIKWLSHSISASGFD